MSLHSRYSPERVDTPNGEPIHASSPSRGVDMPIPAGTSLGTERSFPLSGMVLAYHTKRFKTAREPWPC